MKRIVLRRKYGSLLLLNDLSYLSGAPELNSPHFDFTLYTEESYDKPVRKDSIWKSLIDLIYWSGRPNDLTHFDKRETVKLYHDCKQRYYDLTSDYRDLGNVRKWVECFDDHLTVSKFNMDDVLLRHKAPVLTEIPFIQVVPRKYNTLIEMKYAGVSA